MTKRRIRISCTCGWLFSFSYISGIFIASFYSETSSDNNPTCVYTNHVPVKYFLGLYIPIFVLLILLTLLLNGRMVYVLKKRANNMTSMTSNQHSVTSAQASANAMKKLTFFVTGIILAHTFTKNV